MRDLKLFLAGLGFILFGCVLYQIWNELHFFALVLLGFGYLAIGIGAIALIVWLGRFTAPLIEKIVDIRYKNTQINREKADMQLRFQIATYAQAQGLQLEMPGMKVTYPPKPRVEVIEEQDEPAQLPQQAQSLHPSECLQLAPNFQPHADDVLSGRGLILGVSGSGKSNSVATVSEEIGRLEVPFILADTEDEYRPLCSPRWMPLGKLAGASAGYIVAPDEAKAFGQFILEKDLQIILNLASYSSDDEAASVMVGIIAGLRAWEEERESTNRVSCMFILDEAAVWLPQNVRESRLSDQVLSALQTAFFADLVRRGRKRGMGLTLATQRIAEIDKRALQSNWKILHRQTEQVDIERYKSMGITQEETLSLQDGEAFVFTSKVSKQRVRLRKRYSPHGANTPGLSSVRKHRASLSGNYEISEISDEMPAMPRNFRNDFVEPVVSLHNTSPLPTSSNFAPRNGQKEVPETLKEKIIQCKRRGMKRTEIQGYLNLNGDEYWMVKQVLDEEGL